ncbi:hypothetical protein [Cellulomonas sp. PhB143]|uniref:hypothetical protein n=1 Tax=Cellulomonas sp. PhB143 TaxID=2485186 RepID=UPI000F475E4D|nr:hypothetical protein [Cellulomonas sp. PhB143]ROS74538.1 hypothetical protein EDF32_2285 [Cellulomonas sp. PhB143]
MFVLTIDQQGSTGNPDRVPELLETLSAATATRTGVVLPFERTVGDEVQGLCEDAGTTLDAVLAVARSGGWSTGLGVGTVARPLPPSTREATGDAFVAARAAVDRAKARGTGAALAVDGARARDCRDAEAVLRLVAAVLARRSAPGWEAVDTLAAYEGRRKDVAAALGITEQAVSQRLRAALQSEVDAVRPVAERLLTEADR